MNRRNNKLLGLLLAACCLVACTKTPPRSAAHVTPEESRKITADLADFARWRAGIPSLSAYVQVKIDAGSHRELFDAALLAKPPNRLFLQILDDLGQERARFVADGTQVLFYDAQENTYRLFPQNGDALRKTLRLPISVEALIDRLLMRIPEDQILSVTPETEKNPWEVTHWIQRGQDRLGTAGLPLRLACYEAQDGKQRWNYRIAYSIGTFEWTFRRPKARITMNFKDADIEKKLEDQRFNTTPPETAVPGKIR